MLLKVRGNFLQSATNFILISLCFMACDTKENLNPLQEIMQSDQPKIQAIADHLDKHKVQILYTQIDRADDGKPSFNEINFQLDEDLYFYPASTAKLPVAILAIQKVRALQAEGSSISLDDRFVATHASTGEVVVDKDSTSESGYPSIRHMIKKIFLVSDNDAYNYLFDFLGRDYVNGQLSKLGMEPSHLNHKFLYGADNKHTWEFMFFNEKNELTYEQSSITSFVDGHGLPLKGLIKGVGYTDNEGNLFNEPFDFSEKNFFSLRSLNKILKSIVFPESLPESSRFKIKQEDYEFLRHWMSRNTFESEYPDYKRGDYYESYVKFFMFGDDKSPMPEHIRVYNKVGDAYGTLTDVAYIIDSKNNIEFMLAATVHVNENQIFNDGIYEYDELGFPFMAEIGRQVYNYELNRIK